MNVEGFLTDSCHDVGSFMCYPAPKSNAASVGPHTHLDMTPARKYSGIYGLEFTDPFNCSYV